MRALFYRALIVISIIAATTAGKGGYPYVGTGGLGPTPTPPPTGLPQINPAFAYWKTATDPGSAIKPIMGGLNTFDQVAADNQTCVTEATWCWQYEQPNLPGCLFNETALDQQVEQWYWANDETWALHSIGTTPGPSPYASPPREVFDHNQGKCDLNGYPVPTPTTSPFPTASTQAVAMNPGDTAGNTCFYNRLINGAAQCTGLTTSTCYLAFCSNEALNLDAYGMHYNPWGQQSAEWGNGLQYLPPLTPTFGSYAISYMAARAQQIADYCPVPGSTTGGCIMIGGKWESTESADCCDSNTNPQIIGNHMTPTQAHVHFGAGAYDGRIRFEVFCQALTTPNFQGLWFEDPIDRSQGNLPDLWLGYNSLSYLMVNDTADDCGKPAAKYWMEEQQATNNAYQYWDMQRGISWSMPRPSTGIPDFWPVWRTLDAGCGNTPASGSCNGSGNTTAFEYFSDVAELVPQGPDPTETPAPFGWGGTTLGGMEPSNCQSGSVTAGSPAPVASGIGDTGGNSAQIIGCAAAGMPVVRIEYSHLYSPAGSSCPNVVDVTNQTCDYGPNCTVTNTSNVSVTYNSAWCKDATYTNSIVFSYSTAANFTGTMCAGAWIPTGYTGKYLAAFNAINAQENNTNYSLGVGTGCASYANAIQFNGATPTTIAANTSVTLVTAAAGSGPPSGGTTLWSTADMSRTLGGNPFCGTTACGMEVATGDQCTVGVNTCNQSVSGTGSASIVVLPFGQATSTQRNQANPHCVSSGLQCALTDGSQYLWHFKFIDGNQVGASPYMGVDCRSGHSCGNGTTTHCPGDSGGTCVGDARSLIWQIHPDTCSCTPYTSLNFVNGSNAVSNPQMWGFYDGGPGTGAQTLEWTGAYTAGETDVWDILVTASSPGNCNPGSCTANGAIKLWRNGAVVYDSTVTHPGGVVTMCCAQNSFGINQYSWWNFGPYKWIWDNIPNDSYLNTVDASFANWRYALCPC